MNSRRVQNTKTNRLVQMDAFRKKKPIALIKMKNNWLNNNSSSYTTTSSIAVVELETLELPSYTWYSVQLPYARNRNYLSLVLAGIVLPIICVILVQTKMVTVLENMSCGKRYVFDWSKRQRSQRSMKTGTCWVKGMSCFGKFLEESNSICRKPLV